MIVTKYGQLPSGTVGAPVYQPGEWFEVIGASRPLLVSFDGSAGVLLFPGDLIKLKFQYFSITNTTGYRIGWNVRIGANGTPPIEKGDKGHRSLFYYGTEVVACGIGVATQIWAAGNLTPDSGVNEVTALVIDADGGTGYLGNANASSTEGIYLQSHSPLQIPAGNDLFFNATASINVGVGILAR